MLHSVALVAVVLQISVSSLPWLKTDKSVTHKTKTDFNLYIERIKDYRNGIMKVLLLNVVSLIPWNLLSLKYIILQILDTHTLYIFFPINEVLSSRIVSMYFNL